MPQPRRLTDEQEASALAMNRSGLSIAECARAYSLSWQGMSDCLNRAKGRETQNPSFTGNMDGSDQP